MPGKQPISFHLTIQVFYILFELLSIEQVFGLIESARAKCRGILAKDT